MRCRGETHASDEAEPKATRARYSSRVVHRADLPAVSLPPRGNHFMERSRLKSQPRRARHRGVTGLLWRVEDLFDALLRSRAAPGAHETSHRIDVEHLLQ